MTKVKKSEPYVVKDHIVISYPTRLINYEEDIAGFEGLKMYHLRSFPNSEEIDSNLMRKISDSLYERLQSGRVDKQSGIGFAIVSGKFVNLSMWGNNSPILLHPHLFSFNPESETGILRKLDNQKEGVYCMWEAEIVDHEARAWRRYLSSVEDGKPDLMAYFKDKIEGRLPRIPRH